jgi:predicted  nucleic acid-binding Zn-ribbon protein
MDHELQILLEGMRDDFKAVAEGVQLVNEKLDRHMEENRQAHQRIEADLDAVKGDVFVLKKDMTEVKADVAVLKTDVVEIRKDLNDHRSNTELHAGRQRA